MAKANSNTSDLTGQQFNDWTVIRSAGRSPSGKRLWLCRCKCGRESRIPTSDVFNGYSKRCRPCAAVLVNSRREKSTAHPKKPTPEYRAWQGMKKRCYNKRSNDYAYYGARGIVVCEQWVNDFHAFLKDMHAQVKNTRLTALTTMETTNRTTAAGQQKRSNHRILDKLATSPSMEQHNASRIGRDRLALHPPISSIG